MANVKYSDMLDEVMPAVPGVPQLLAVNAVRNSAIKFCRRSTIWRYWPDPQTIIAGVNFYDFDTPSDTEVAEVMLLKVDGTHIDPSSEDDLPDDWNTKTGPPDKFMQQDTTGVYLTPVPDGKIANGLTMSVALAPKRSSSSLPDWIWSRYFEAIAAGAKADLMAIPEKPWTNPNASVYFQGIFDTAVAGAQRDANSGMTRAVVRTTSQH
jgi:hypothetical protein